jgi:hypothetical protein
VAWDTRLARYAWFEIAVAGSLGHISA